MKWLFHWEHTQHFQTNPTVTGIAIHQGLPGPQSFTTVLNWAAQHDESGRVARYHLTWLICAVLRLSWQSTRFQNPRQKAGNYGPLFFLIALFIHGRNGQIDDLGTGPWLLEHPENWLTGSIIESKRPFFGYYIIFYNSIYIILYILYYILLYIYIYYIIYIYILSYITLNNYLFSRGGPYLSHHIPLQIGESDPIAHRPRYPSSTSSIPNDRAFIEASLHRCWFQRFTRNFWGFAESGSPKNKTDTRPGND